jgi:hypothetical protein
MSNQKELADEPPQRPKLKVQKFKENTLELPEKYVIQKISDTGFKKKLIHSVSYGVIYSAIDTSTNKTVFIEHYKDVEQHLDKSAELLREIKILKQLDHENVSSFDNFTLLDL